MDISTNKVMEKLVLDTFQEFQALFYTLQKRKSQLEKFNCHFVDNSFPSDLNFKFHPYTLPKSCSNAEMEAQMTLENEIIVAAKIKILQSRIAALTTNVDVLTVQLAKFDNNSQLTEKFAAKVPILNQPLNRPRVIAATNELLLMKSAFLSDREKKICSNISASSTMDEAPAATSPLERIYSFVEDIANRLSRLENGPRSRHATASSSGKGDKKSATSGNKSTVNQRGGSPKPSRGNQKQNKGSSATAAHGSGGTRKKK